MIGWETELSVSRVLSTYPCLLSLQSPVVTICTTSLTFTNPTFCPHTAFMCFVWISEQTAIISQYNINWLVCITETECVYCAVRAGSSTIKQVNLCLKSINPQHNSDEAIDHQTVHTVPAVCFRTANGPTAMHASYDLQFHTVQHGHRDIYIYIR